jgi:DNA modification methylase
MSVRILTGDSLAMLRKLRPQSVNCCVTSPPYFGLRDYGVSGQIGLEKTPELYIQRMVEVFREVRRVLRDDGTLWLNLGDSYAGSWGNQERQSFRAGNPAKNGGVSNRDGLPKLPGLKPKDLIGIPWMVAFALRADGWYLRSDIIWHKPNPMPESVRDRCTKAHEYLFLLAKREKYYYDAAAIAEVSVDKESISGRNKRNRDKFAHHDSDGMARTRAGFANIKPGTIYLTRNRRSVWTVVPKPYKGAHFATFPPALVEPCILAGCPQNGTVLDPFAGSGTTLQVARDLGQNGVGIELNPEYVNLAYERLKVQSLIKKAA